MDNSNPDQVFNFILARNDNERIQSYIDVFTRVKQCTIPQPKNKLFLYYSAQKIYSNLLIVKKQLFEYLRIQSNTKNIYTIINENIDFISNMYKKLLNNTNSKPISYTLTNERINTKLYNLDVNAISKSLLEQFNIDHYKCNNIYYKQKQLIELILTNNSMFTMSDVDHKFYIDNLKELLSTNILIQDNYKLKINTLKFILNNL